MPHTIRFEILQTKWKNKTNSIKMLDLLMKKLKTKSLIFIVSFFYLIFHNMWTAKRLVKASCTEVTLTLDSSILFRELIKNLIFHPLQNLKPNKAPNLKYSVVHQGSAGNMLLVKGQILLKFDGSSKLKANFNFRYLNSISRTN